MPSDMVTTVSQTVTQLRTLYITSAMAEWDAATNGTPENLEKNARARAAFMKFLADKEIYEQIRDWDKANSAAHDPMLARQIRQLYYAFAQNQRDDASIEEMTRLMTTLGEAYTN